MTTAEQIDQLLAELAAIQNDDDLFQSPDDQAELDAIDRKYFN